MQAARKVSTAERVLAAVFSAKTLIGLFLPVATIYFRGCKGGPERPPEIFTGWQLIPHDCFLYAVPLVAVIALLCAIFNRRLQNVLFALFWNAVKVIPAVFAVWSFGLGMHEGYHGDEAEPWVGFWLVLAGASGILVLWWFNMFANLKCFRRFWKERNANKVRSRLLASVILGGWFFGLAIPALDVGLSIYVAARGGVKTVFDVALLAAIALISVAFFILFFSLKFGLRRGQAWAALCHIAVSVVFIALAVLILHTTLFVNPDKLNWPFTVIGFAVAAWFIYTIVAIILIRKTFRRATAPPLPNVAIGPQQ